MTDHTNTEITGPTGQPTGHDRSHKHRKTDKPQLITQTHKPTGHGRSHKHRKRDKPTGHGRSHKHRKRDKPTRQITQTQKER